MTAILWKGPGSEAGKFYLAAEKDEKGNRSDYWSEQTADQYSSDLAAKITADAFGIPEGQYSIVPYPKGLRPEQPQPAKTRGRYAR